MAIRGSLCRSVVRVANTTQELAFTYLIVTSHIKIVLFPMNLTFTCFFFYVSTFLGNQRHETLEKRHNDVTSLDIKVI